jgi:hypothetical protein
MEEHRLKEFEMRVLRRIDRQKCTELTVGYRELHKEELHDFFTKNV